jgi:hypothetical protein
MIEISLRKASALASEVLSTINNIPTVGTVELNEFEDAKEVIDKANETLFVNINRINKLNNVFTKIRREVGRANVSCGIHDKLTDINALNRMIAHLKVLIDDDVLQPDIKVIIGKLRKLESSAETPYQYGRKDTITVGHLTSEDFDLLKGDLARLLRERQQLNDEVLELNVSTKVSMSDEDLDVLKSERLM